MGQTQTAKHHHRVDPIHEFGRKIPLGRFQSGPIDLLIQVTTFHLLGSRRGKADVPFQELAQFFGPQVGGHENDCSGEIDLAVIAQGEGCLVQDSQEKLPQCRRILLNLVKENKAEIVAVVAVPIENFLGQDWGSLFVSKVSGW